MNPFIDIAKVRANIDKLGDIKADLMMLRRRMRPVVCL